MVPRLPVRFRLPLFVRAWSNGKADGSNPSDVGSIPAALVAIAKIKIRASLNTKLYDMAVAWLFLKECDFMLNPFLILLILIGAVLLWFLLVFLFKPIGRITGKIVKDAIETMNEEESEGKGK